MDRASQPPQRSSIFPSTLTTMFSLVLVVAVAARVVSSQSLSGLSSGCVTTLAGISANSDAAACLNPGALIPLVAGGSNSSVVPTIDSWLTGLCSAPACSNATLQAVVTNVTSGCSSELSSTGITSDMSASLASLIQQYYPTVREVACLKDGNTNCVTQTLNNIQGTTGSLSLSNIVSITSNPPNLPANVTCTNCVKAAYNIINTSFPSLLSSVASDLNTQCGQSFLDGTTPSGISQSATTNTAPANPSSPSNAKSVTMQGNLFALGVSGLVTVLTGFVLIV